MVLAYALPPTVIAAIKATKTVLKSASLRLGLSTTNLKQSPYRSHHLKYRQYLYYIIEKAETRSALRTTQIPCFLLKFCLTPSHEKEPPQPRAATPITSNIIPIKTIIDNKNILRTNGNNARNVLLPKLSMIDTIKVNKPTKKARFKRSILITF